MVSGKDKLVQIPPVKETRDTNYNNSTNHTNPHQISKQQQHRFAAMNKTNTAGENQLGRYVLEVPPGIYPLNGDDPTVLPHSNTASSFNVNSRKEYIYPDFNRWVYQVEQDNIMQQYLQKGYYDPPSVSNELLSARSAVHQYLHTETKQTTNPAVGAAANKVPIHSSPKLHTLSDTVVKAIKYRRKCNKVSMKSTYKPPPRVTLTEYKKEMWLKNLANPEIPLSRLSRTIPHGIRNKALLEQCCSKKIPITRALWFVKCVGTNELRGLKRKNGPGMMVVPNHGKAFEQNWIHDWTVQVTEYIEKMIRDCFITNGGENHTQWKQNLDYIVHFVSHLYLSELMSRETFLSWIVRFLKKISNDDNSEPSSEYSTGDFKLIAVHLIFLKAFWFKIIKIEYLSKEISETLLMIYYKLQEGKLLTKSLNLKLSKSFKFLILYLFYYNSSSFILSNHWITLKPVLKRIIDDNDPIIAQQFELITYRNESLLMNLPDSGLNLSFESTLIKRLDNFNGKDDLEDLSIAIFEESTTGELSRIERGNLELKDSIHWKFNLELLLNWCLTKFRKTPRDQVYLTVSIIKSFVKRCTSKNSKSLARKAKQDIETIILEFIYSLNDKYTNNIQCGEKSLPIDLNVFLKLINELYTMKAFTVSSYLRRLISSGIIYLPNAESKTRLHILIIKNLPILNNAQCASILKSLVGETNYQAKIEEEFTKSKNLLEICLQYLFERDSSTLEIDNNSNIWIDFENLNQGIKFLAVDYFLREFRNRISESSKLVNLNNTKISIVYKLFTHLHSQSRFFQDFLTIVLVNETRMINYYLETLYFISSLVVANFNLVQRLVPAAHDAIQQQQQQQQQQLQQQPQSPPPPPQQQQQQQHFTNSMFPSLLRLIITNYNTINDDDPYDFTKIWKFGIENVGIKYSIILSELNVLISKKTITLNKDVIAENALQNLKTIGLSLSVEHFLNSDRLRANELKLLERLLSLIKMELNGTSTEEIEFSFQITIVQLLTTLKIMNQTEFVLHIVEFCNTSILPSLYLDFDSYLNFAMKLIIFELIDIMDLVEIFSKESSISDNITGNSNHRLIWHILLDNKPNSTLSIYESIKFQIIRDEFRHKHVDKLLEFIKIGINDAQSSFSITTSPENGSSVIENQFTVVHNEDPLPTPISNNVVTTPLPMMGGSTPMIVDSLSSNSGRNSFINSFEDQLSITFNKVAFTDIQLLLNKIVTKLNKDLILDIFNGMVLLESKEISQPKDLEKLIDIVNVFNLPLCQIILKIVWESELGPDKSEEFKSVAIQDHLMSMFMKLSNYKKTIRSDKDLCFNQLFNLLNPSLKMLVLDSCKSFFLRSEHFPQVYVTSNEDSLIPNLNEIINNCSRAMVNITQTTTTTSSTHDVIPLNDSLVFSLNTALEKLIYAAEKFQTTSTSTQSSNLEPSSSLQQHIPDNNNNNNTNSDLASSIKLILKIVLIHKHFLVKMILKRSNDVSNDSFIQNLSRLYKTKIVRRDSKLKNYFYDSLLSFEFLFTETIEAQLANKQQQPPPPQQVDPMMYNQSRLTSTSTISTNIFKLPPLNTQNILSSYLSQVAFKDALIDYNPPRLLYLYNEKEDAYQEFNARPFDLIEEANPVASMNSTSISLQLFNAATERKNPP